MKKSILRIITFILSVVVICSALTGCNVLDNLKEAHAKQDENGNVIYKGNTYLPLDPGDNYYFSPETDKHIVITEADVPVLLSNFIAKYTGSMTEDESIMRVSGGVWSYDLESDIFFCREDKYDEVKKLLAEEFKPEVYSYSYYYWDEDDNELSGFYILTEEQENALKEVISSPAEEDLDVSYSNDFIDIYEATRDQLFRKKSLRIFYNMGSYIVENPGNNFSVHIVPSNLNPIFDEIVKIQRESDKYWGYEYDDVYEEIYEE